MICFTLSAEAAAPAALHGLRVIGLMALKMRGMENRGIRSLTGHDRDAELEIYLRGAKSYEMARDAAEALEGILGAVLARPATKGNATKAAGFMGRAATRGRLETELKIGKSSSDRPPGKWRIVYGVPYGCHTAKSGCTIAVQNTPRKSAIKQV